jgi:hypothetical protein
MVIATFRNEIKGARERGELKRVSVLIELVVRKDGATIGG